MLLVPRPESEVVRLRRIVGVWSRGYAETVAAARAEIARLQAEVDRLSGGAGDVSRPDQDRAGAYVVVVQLELPTSGSSRAAAEKDAVDWVGQALLLAGVPGDRIKAVGSRGPVETDG